MKNLLDYIQGKRKGKKAHDLEREAMLDPFLQESLDGYDEIKGKHWENIIQIQRRILSKTQKEKTKISYFYRYAAASVLILFSIGGYFLLENQNNEKSGEIVYHKTETEDGGYLPSPYLSKESVVELQEKKASNSEENKSKAQQNISLAVKPKVSKKEEIEMYDRRVLNFKATPQAVRDSEEYLAYNNNYPSKIMEGKTITAESISSDEVLDSKKQEENVLFADNISKRKTNKHKESGAIAASKNTAKAQVVPIIGIELYNQYLKNNLLISKEKNCKKGTIILQFMVNTEGRPQDIKIIQSLCKTIDTQLIDLILKGSDWTEGQGFLNFEL